MTYVVLTLGTLAIASAVVSVFAYEHQCYRLAVATEAAAATFGFACGVLLPFLILMVTEP